MPYQQPTPEQIEGVRKFEIERKALVEKVNRAWAEGKRLKGRHRNNK